MSRFTRKTFASFISFASVASLSLIPLLSGCSSSTTPDTSAGTVAASSVTTSTLSLSLSATSVGYGGQVQLTASGGIAPYTYGLVIGAAGTVDASNGIFTAPYTNETAEVYVEDSTGTFAYLPIVVSSSITSSSVLTVNPVSIMVDQTVALSVSGGFAPYTYALSSAPLGTLSSSGGVEYYSALSLAGTDTVTVTDSEGNSGVIVITVLPASTTSTSTFALTKLTLSPEGQHIVGGGGCSNGYHPAGEVADANLGKIHGDQIMCTNTQEISSVNTVISDIYLTPGGSHPISGYSCPAGYTWVGGVTDCEGQDCLGNQILCAEYVPVASATRLVTDFYVTPEGLHIVGGPGCDAGYTPVGDVADCGGASSQSQCKGNQNFCVKYAE